MSFKVNTSSMRSKGRYYGAYENLVGQNNEYLEKLIERNPTNKFGIILVKVAKEILKERKGQ